MFGWFDPVKKLEKRYQKALETAELELAKSGDRAKHGRMIASAEAIGRELDEAKAKQNA